MEMILGYGVAVRSPHDKGGVDYDPHIEVSDQRISTLTSCENQSSWIGK